MSFLDGLAFWAVASIGLGLTFGRIFAVAAGRDRAARNRHRTGDQ